MRKKSPPESQTDHGESIWESWLRLSLTYALLAGLYILISSTVAGKFVGSVDELRHIEIAKGIFFVIFTSTIFAIFLYRMSRRMEINHIRLREKTSRLEKELLERKEIESRLRKAQEAAESANKAKSRFIANMSHELRTPLHAIIGTVDLLEDSFPNRDTVDFVEIIRSASDSLLALVNDILDLATVESGRYSLQLSSFRLEELLHSIANLFEQRFAEKQIRFAFTLDRNVPDPLVGDAQRLRQTLINLLGNSVKFTEREGHISLRVALESQSPEVAVLLFEISDSGIGFPEEDAKRIFEPFTQLDPSDTRPQAGVGLGLAIAAELVQLMNGKIWATSRSGIGSTFSFTATFRLPRLEEMQHGARSLNGASLNSPKSIPSLKVLLVEDNLVNQRVAETILRKEGHDVTTADNGAIAVQLFGAAAFDLILMDLQMPVCDGIEATKQIRQRERANPELTPVLIIAMTACASNEDKERCLAAGMNEFIAKPVQRHELRRIMAHVIAAHTTNV